LRLAVIVDGGAVQRFALNPLDTVTGTDEISVYTFTNTRIRKRWIRHAAYYALNLITVHNRLTRRVPVGWEATPLSRMAAFISAGKIRFYLKHTLNPEILPVSEPANRYYPYLIAIPSDRKDRFDLT
jgi:hypothetical protein